MNGRENAGSCKSRRQFRSSDHCTESCRTGQLLQFVAECINVAVAEDIVPLTLCNQEILYIGPEPRFTESRIVNDNNREC